LNSLLKKVPAARRARIYANKKPANEIHEIAAVFVFFVG
jgi:hypothetical protein